MLSFPLESMIKYYALSIVKTAKSPINSQYRIYAVLYANKTYNYLIIDISGGKDLH